MFDPIKFSEIKVPVQRVKFGLFQLDFTGGYRSNDFIVLAAATGVGKSLLALWIAISATEQGKKVMYIDYENDASLIEERLVSFGKNYKSAIANNLLKLYTQSAQEKIIIQKSFTERNFNLHKFIFDKITAIENAIILHQPNLLVIDVFSCLYKNIAPTNLTSQLTYILSESISTIAKKHNCAIIATEQLKNDKIYGRPGEKDVATGNALTHKATKIITLFSYFKENRARTGFATDLSIKLEDFLEVILVKDRTNDIAEKIYVHKKDIGFHQPNTHEYAAYFDYINNKAFK